MLQKCMVTVDPSQVQIAEEKDMINLYLNGRIN